MKKQNVNNKLAFNKAAVTELNTIDMNQVNGGAMESSTGCLCDVISIITKATRPILL